MSYDLVTEPELIELWLEWLEENPELVDPWTLDQPARGEVARCYVARFVDELWPGKTRPRKLRPTLRIVEFYRFRPDGSDLPA